MRALSPDDAASIREMTQPGEWDVLNDLATDDAVQTAYTGTQPKTSPPSRQAWRRISLAEVKRRLLEATDTGRLGEELFNMWLRVEGITGNWVSDEFAYAPYDFIVNAPWIEGQESCIVDVKATSAPGNNRLHLSRNELLHAADNPSYIIARWAGLKRETPTLAIYTGVTELAASTLAVLENLPSGVNIDSIVFNTAHLNLLFKHEINLERLAAKAAELDDKNQ